MPGNTPPLRGEDIRDAMRMAADTSGDVQKDILKLASESRFKILQGDQRRDFFKGMTQDEFDILHSLAMSMGPNGLVAMERLMREAEEIYNGG